MSDPATVFVARHAMATRFEIVLHGEDQVGLRAAGEEALEEIQRLERQLNLYEASSEISCINARAAAGPVKVEPRLFRLLHEAQRFWRLTGGAFDITVAPLMRCWGFIRGSGHPPSASEIAEAREKVGMNLVELNEAEFTIRFVRDGVMLDLGSIGKGYALERAVELLIEAGVASAILHGGTSTVCALGSPPDADAWRVAIPHPDFAREARAPGAASPSPGSAGAEIVAVVPLRNEAMSVSAVWGKSFEAGGKVYGHVMDPRRGEPVQGAVLAAVASPSATETDAFSTALLTLGADGLDQVAGACARMRALVATASDEAGGYQISARGFELVQK